MTFTGAKAGGPNAASVAILRGDEVLLIQRAFEPLQGLWTLPGGRREPGETIEETAIREIREEVALAVFGLRPVLVMPVAARFHLQVFATRQFEGVISPSPEIMAWHWSKPDQLAGLPTTPGLADVLARAFSGR